MVVNLLADFLADYGARPWQPGTVDCCLMLADWAVMLGHPDPAHDLRGSYVSDKGFETILEQAGGALPVVARCAGRVGGVRMQYPFAGAIGVIGSLHNPQRQWGAIYDGGQWQVRMTDRVGPVTAPMLASWMIT